MNLYANIRKQQLKESVDINALAEKMLAFDKKHNPYTYDYPDNEQALKDNLELLSSNDLSEPLGWYEQLLYDKRTSEEDKATAKEIVDSLYALARESGQLKEADNNELKEVDRLIMDLDANETIYDIDDIRFAIDQSNISQDAKDEANAALDSYDGIGGFLDQVDEDDDEEREETLRDANNEAENAILDAYKTDRDTLFELFHKSIDEAEDRVEVAFGNEKRYFTNDDPSLVTAQKVKAKLAGLEDKISLVNTNFRGDGVEVAFKNDTNSISYVRVAFDKDGNIIEIYTNGTTITPEFIDLVTELNNRK